MNRFLRWLRAALAMVVAAWVTAALAAPITSLSNLIWLYSISMPVDAGTVVTVIIRDIFRFGPVLSILLIIAYTLAFSVTGLVRIRWPVRTEMIYGIAAAVAMLATLFLLPEATFKVQMIAGNRTYVGTFFHLVAAAVGGLVFARLIAGPATLSFAIRVLGCVPLFFMLWNSFSWATDPFAASSGMGVDLTALAVAGQSTVIRDLTAFFITSATLLLVAMYGLNYRWFFAVAILFFYAALFNFLNGQLRDIVFMPALIFEVVFCVWVLGLGLAAAAIRKPVFRPGRGSA